MPPSLPPMPPMPPPPPPAPSAPPHPPLQPCECSDNEWDSSAFCAEGGIQHGCAKCEAKKAGATRYWCKIASAPCLGSQNASKAPSLQREDGAMVLCEPPPSRVALYVGLCVAVLFAAALVISAANKVRILRRRLQQLNEEKHRLQFEFAMAQRHLETIIEEPLSAHLGDCDGEEGEEGEDEAAACSACGRSSVGDYQQDRRPSVAAAAGQAELASAGTLLPIRWFGRPPPAAVARSSTACTASSNPRSSIASSSSGPATRRPSTLSPVRSLVSALSEAFTSNNEHANTASLPLTDRLLFMPPDRVASRVADASLEPLAGAGPPSQPPSQPPSPRCSQGLAARRNRLLIPGDVPTPEPRGAAGAALDLGTVRTFPFSLRRSPPSCSDSSAGSELDGIFDNG